MEKITKQKTILLMGIILLSISQMTFGYTGNVISSGAFLTHATPGSEIREMVELKKMGHLLVGKPQKSSLNLLTIYAPNIRESQIIIRELRVTNGKISLFLSAPRLLEESTKRISLFFDQKYSGNVLLEARDNTWIEHQALPLQVFADKELSTQNNLIAFSTQKIGAYWLIRNDLTELSNLNSNEYNISANALLSGGISGSFMAVGLALLLLLMGWKISTWQHARQLK